MSLVASDAVDWSDSLDDPTPLLSKEMIDARNLWSPHQRAAPFFPEVHDKYTKSWCASYLARLQPSASTALTATDGTEEKGYEKLPPLDEAVAERWLFGGAGAPPLAQPNGDKGCCQSCFSRLPSVVNRPLRPCSGWLR